MNSEFSDEQRLLRDQARRFLDDNAPLGAEPAFLDDGNIFFGQGTYGPQSRNWAGRVASFQRNTAPPIRSAETFAL